MERCVHVHYLATVHSPHTNCLYSRPQSLPVQVNLFSFHPFPAAKWQKDIQTYVCDIEKLHKTLFAISGTLDIQTHGQRYLATYMTEFRDNVWVLGTYSNAIYTCRFPVAAQLQCIYWICTSTSSCRSLQSCSRTSLAPYNPYTACYNMRRKRKEKRIYYYG